MHGNIQRRMRRANIIRGDVRNASACLVLAIALCGWGAHAQQLTEGPPELISYQGTAYLASDGTTPISGAADIAFRLYANENDPVANALWGEIHQDVSILNGVFNVYIGAGDSIPSVPTGSVGDIFTSAPLWLGIQIGLDEEISQRQKITSVPFAMTAKHVTTAIHGAPVGTMMMYAGSTAPAGWAFCNGQAVNGATDTQYAALFAAIGTTWGGTGITNFSLPDMRGVTPIGAGVGIDANTISRSGATAGLQSRPVGTRVGTETHTLTVAQMPAHTHSYTDRYVNGRFSGERFSGLFNAADSPTDTERTTSSTGGSGAHNNVQPSTYINFIIKL